MDLSLEKCPQLELCWNGSPECALYTLVATPEACHRWAPRSLACMPSCKPSCKLSCSDTVDVNARRDAPLPPLPPLAAINGVSPSLRFLRVARFCFTLARAHWLVTDHTYTLVSRQRRTLLRIGVTFCVISVKYLKGDSASTIHVHG